MSKVTKIKETICYEENDIKVFIKINYLLNEISLVEPYDSEGRFKKKSYTFSDRGVEFMSSWLTILQAMQNAIKLGKAMYEKELAEESKFKVEQDLKFIEKVIKIDNKLKKK